MHRYDPTWPQHRLDLGPTSASKAPTSAQHGSKQLGLMWEQLRPKFRSIWIKNEGAGRIRFLLFLLLMKLRLKLGPSLCEAVAKGESIWIAFGPTSAQRPIGADSRNLRPRLGQVGPWGHPGAKLGPARANFADPMRHAENLQFYLCFQCFFWALMRICARACWARRCQMPPRQNQVAHAKPNLRPNVPKLRHVSRKLAPVRLELGPS